jgi:hypothetical protein
VHGRRIREAESIADVEKTSEGLNTRRATSFSGFRPAKERTLQEEQSSVAERGCLGLAASAGAVNGKRATAPRGVRLLGVTKALKVKPQERYRDEISPERRGRVQTVESVRNAEDGRWRVR